MHVKDVAVVKRYRDFVMKKSVRFLAVIGMAFLMGCSHDDNVSVKTINNRDNGNDEISYETVVCEYTSIPTCWTALDIISTNVKIYADNTVEVYCGDFEDNGIEVAYIYGETFEITEEQKQDVIDAIKKNKIYKIKNCGDEDSCDGSYSFINLFDEKGEVVHCCGGLNPSNKKFQNAKNVIFSVLPEDTFKDVHNKATEVLIEYLIENYPEEYEWLREN